MNVKITNAQHAIMRNAIWGGKLNMDTFNKHSNGLKGNHAETRTAFTTKLLVL